MCLYLNCTSLTTSGSIIVIPVFCQVVNEYTINKFRFGKTTYANSSTTPGMVLSEHNLAYLNRSITPDINSTTLPTGPTSLDRHIRNLVNTPIDVEKSIRMFSIKDCHFRSFTLNSKILI